MTTDWTRWTPRERANLCFIVQKGRILLIRKKRGLGAGKINGPGGRIEPGETPVEAAVRETREELCVTPLDPEMRGELHFQFADGYSLYCVVFVATEFTGTPTETDEAEPLWHPVDGIPFDEMWADDSHWLPGVIEGQRFRGFFEFDGEQLLDFRMTWLEDGERFAT